MYEGKNPCYGCDHRDDKCHSKCPDYTSWKARHEASRAEKAKERDLEYGLRRQVLDIHGYVYKKKKHYRKDNR